MELSDLHELEGLKMNGRLGGEKNWSWYFIRQGGVLVSDTEKSPLPEHLSVTLAFRVATILVLLWDLPGKNPGCGCPQHPEEPTGCRQDVPGCSSHALCLVQLL